MTDLLPDPRTARAALAPLVSVDLDDERARRLYAVHTVELPRRAG